MLEFVAAFLLVLISACVFLTPRVFQLCGQILGWQLRSRTKQRRELLLARVATERQIWEDKLVTASTTLDDEWEKVDRSRSQSLLNGDSSKKADAAWNGLIGFFHPFWYVCLWMFGNKKTNRS